MKAGKSGPSDLPWDRGRPARRFTTHFALGRSRRGGRDARGPRKKTQRRLTHTPPDGISPPTLSKHSVGGRVMLRFALAVGVACAVGLFGYSPAQFNASNSGSGTTMPGQPVSTYRGQAVPIGQQQPQAAPPAGQSVANGQMQQAYDPSKPYDPLTGAGLDPKNVLVPVSGPDGKPVAPPDALDRLSDKIRSFFRATPPPPRPAYAPGVGRRAQSAAPACGAATDWICGTGLQTGEASAGVPRSRSESSRFTGLETGATKRRLTRSAGTTPGTRSRRQSWRTPRCRSPSPGTAACRRGRCGRASRPAAVR